MTRTYEVRCSVLITVDAESSEDAQLQAASMIAINGDTEHLDIDTEAVWVEADECADEPSIIPEAYTRWALDKHTTEGFWERFIPEETKAKVEAERQARIAFARTRRGRLAIRYRIYRSRVREAAKVLRGQEVEW